MVSSKLCISSGLNTPEFDVYLNDDNHIFFGNNDLISGFFCLDKEDWVELKSFVDAQFKAIEQKEQENG